MAGTPGTDAVAALVRVTGVVQGVGFRPFVWRLAGETGVSGWVLNDSEGVLAHVEGAPDAVEAFTRRVQDDAPPMAVIDSVEARDVPSEGLDAFEIRGSEAHEGLATLVSPDIATCPACEHELKAPGDRRHGYPFVNCTNCGPRFTIIDDVPYDRPATTMRDFPMCATCAAEYADPADRRFHAQPNACFVCGPRLYLNAAGASDPRGGEGGGWVWTPSVEASPRPHRDATDERERTEAIIQAVADLLRGGAIVAIKGLGGFQLACDATSEEAVARLRERKHRYGKPLAMMVCDLHAARKLAHLSPEEEALLSGPVRPIVLVRHRGDEGEPRIARSVHIGLGEAGIMLPYTPLHHLLIEAVDRPLVMTSGNRSEEPIATGNAEALERLSDIADALLLHDREIRSRYDDSVVRVLGGAVRMVRRARGYAPHPLKLPGVSDISILAAGPEQKNTFCLVKGSSAFVSQHIGDLENAETLASWEETLALYERLFRVTPQLVAYDLHPEYLSTKQALGMGLPAEGVQHHHAHVASVTAEHAVGEPVVGIALDGTGYGDDGRIWGGEVLVADWAGYERAAHLAYVPMPGGAAAVRRPARMAVGTLVGLDPALIDHPGTAPLRDHMMCGELDMIRQIAEKGVNSPLTSSMGRLFDVVAALAGVRYDAMYEGQAAMELEARLDPSVDGAYAFELRAPRDGETAGSPIVMDPTPVVAAVLDDVAAGLGAGAVSARFHRTVVRLVADIAERVAAERGLTRVALSGGVFMNRFVMEGAATALAERGLTPLTHVRLPDNDGAISYGQAVVAWARRGRSRP